ncbi:hypothetical protein [Aquipuribacter sp. SD81]|uniref:hypothetical protein n=1 Tax=Aquipuribacter sp. SD81 TaxID=3127703 RepID=UPI00301A2511
MSTTANPAAFAAAHPAHPAVPSPAHEVADASTRAAARRPRAWAWTGVAAGVLGVAAIQMSLLVTPVYDDATAGDAEAITTAMGDLVPALLAFHLTTTTLLVLLPVVAAGLHRRLRTALPGTSLLPGVAAAGLLLVAAAALMGSALDTEFIFAAGEPDRVVPESVAFYGHWVGTVPWLWVGAGISGVAVAVASLRHGAVPRWLGVVGLVLGGLTLLLGVSPLQYMAGFTGPVWLLVTMLGLALGDRRAA